jgi:hypothetical protein
MTVTIGRRELLAALGGAAVAWPLAARAQQAARVPRIGIVDDAPMWHSFRQALREFGYVEGQSVNYEYRYSEGVPDRLADGRHHVVLFEHSDHALYIGQQPGSELFATVVVDAEGHGQLDEVGFR